MYKRQQEISFSDTRNVILTDAEIKKYALSAGDVIFVRVNGSKENVGKSYYFEGKPFPVAYCDHLIRCTPTIVLCGKLLSMFKMCIRDRGRFVNGFFDRATQEMLC